MPAVGFGVYGLGPNERTMDAVTAAIDAGYRLIDTASGYGNETEVGRAVRESGLERSAVFVTTKLKPADYGFDKALFAFDESMTKLGLGVIDLYLLHWPVPLEFERTVATWKACERLLAEGRIRAIGVSNFTPAHIDALLEQCEVVPAVNQIELHPYFVQLEHDLANRQLGIVTQAWAPMGGIDRYWAAHKRDVLSDPAITALAAKYDRTPAQIILRWHIQQGRSVIPKSQRPERIRENIAIFDFALESVDVDSISALDTGQRGGPDPEAVGINR